MSEMNAPRLAALQQTIQGLCPGLSLALAEELTQECLLEATSATLVPIASLLTGNESIVNTVFSLSQPFGAESILVFSDEGSVAMSKALAVAHGTAPSEFLTESDVARLEKTSAGLIRGFAIGLTNITGDVIDLESNVTVRGVLVLPPVFALEDHAVQVILTLTMPDTADTELHMLLTPEFVNELVPETGESEEMEESGLTENELAAMLNELEDPEVSPVASSAPEMTGVSPFPSLNYSRAAEVAPRGIELIMDIPLDVTVELGRVRMLIRDVLELASGSIVELDRMAGEPVDLLVNGRLIAKGEVVVIEDNFGLRLTEIVSPADRVAGLSKKRAA